MAYATFLTAEGEQTWGVLRDGALVDLGPTGAGIANTLREAIGDGTWSSPGGDIERMPRRRLGEVTFLPPIPDPSKILCVGVNYRAHREEAGRAADSAPTVFTRFADSQIGHDRPALYPAHSEQFDYEGELALVIGRGGFRIPAEGALAHVAGYAPYNDFSARDWQRAASQWTPGKNFPGTGAFGPFLTPAAQVDLDSVRLQTRVNGAVRQDAALSDLIHGVPELIAYISSFTPLAPGDVIVTGTPGGVGLFMDPPALLQPGDDVEVEVTGMPVLRNRVEREAA